MGEGQYPTFLKIVAPYFIFSDYFNVLSFILDACTSKSWTSQLFPDISTPFPHPRYFTTINLSTYVVKPFILQLIKRKRQQIHLLMLLCQLIHQLTYHLVYQLHCLKTKSKSPILDSMSYVCCVIAVVPTEKNNGASEASLNTPNESVDESVDRAT